MGKTKIDPCQKFACALQSCLQANDFQECKCASVLEALYECCSTAGKHSVVCSGIHPRETLDHSDPVKFKCGKVVEDAPKDSQLKNTPEKP